MKWKLSGVFCRIQTAPASAAVSLPCNWMSENDWKNVISAQDYMLMYRGQKETAKEHIDAYFIHLQGWALGNHDCFEAICSPSANTMHLYIGNRGQSLLWSPQSIPPIVLLAHIKIDVRLRTITLQAIDGNVNSSGFWNIYSLIDHLNRCTLFIDTVLIQN